MPATIYTICPHCDDRLQPVGAEENEHTVVKSTKKWITVQCTDCGQRFKESH